MYWFPMPIKLPIVNVTYIVLKSTLKPREIVILHIAYNTCVFCIWQNRDGMLSKAEFREGSKCDPWIVQALSMDMPLSDKSPTTWAKT